MPLLWLGIGLLLGIGIATLRAHDVFSENERLRDTLQHLRTMAQLGDRRGIVKVVDRVLEQEVA